MADYQSARAAGIAAIDELDLWFGQPTLSSQLAGCGFGLQGMVKMVARSPGPMFRAELVQPGSQPVEAATMLFKEELAALAAPKPEQLNPVPDVPTEDQPTMEVINIEAPKDDSGR